MTTGSPGAAACVSGVWRGAPIAALPSGAPRGARTEIATRGTGEERPETPRTTGEEGTESGIGETTEKEAEVRICYIFHQLKIKRMVYHYYYYYYYFLFG